MANILISHFSPIQHEGKFTSGCFFEALAKGFQDCGHNVKQMISTRFLPKSWNGNNQLHDHIDRERLKKDILDFAPDLCIFGNNSVPEVAYEATDCPVVLLLSDTVSFFNDKDKILARAYGDRLFFYAPFQRDLDEIDALFGKHAGKVLHLLPATGVQAENIPFEHNISFIGSNFQNDKSLGQLIRDFPDQRRMQQILEILRRDTSSLSFLSEAEKQFIGERFPLDHFPFVFSARDRLLCLTLLSEEGLSLFGSPTWHEAAQHFPDVAAAFHPRTVYSLQHNQDIYNASKVCLSVSHTQAQDGFPWRIMDIMASNGCLLSDRKSGLANFTKGHVDLPVYDSPAEAHALAQRLLKDEAWRQDLVAGAQACIAEKGLWKHRFRDMQEIIGIPLLLPPGTAKGSLTHIQGEDYVIPSLYHSASSQPRRHPWWRRKSIKIAKKIIKKLDH